MNFTRVTSKKHHFHIHWTNKDSVDWEPFDSQQRAEARALELARFGELFTIEDFCTPCSVCKPKAMSAKL